LRLARAESQEAGGKGDDPLLAEQAGLLHDISAVIPNSVRLETAQCWGLAVLPEETACPMLLHQGLSAVMARILFGIDDPKVLSAIGCHTTLQAGASRLDKIVFVADKLAWDQAGLPPYLAGLQAALEHSLDEAALFYLEYLRDHLAGPLHPWARAALAQLQS
jgi:predicted HD superfamily hydrolase involved in NAD metabolism